MDNLKIKQSQIVFGDIVYWLTVVAAIICMIGPLMSFISMDGNVLNPQYLFANIWSGMEPDGILKTAGEIKASGHYWINNLSAGDGFTQLGLVIGCSSAFLALLGSSIAYLRQKPRAYGWALIALFVAAMVLLSAVGIYGV